MFPIHGAGMERQGRDVALGGDGLGEMVSDVHSLWEVNGVPAELGENVLPDSEPDHLLAAVPHPSRVAQQSDLRD